MSNREQKQTEEKGIRRVQGTVKKINVYRDEDSAYDKHKINLTLSCKLDAFVAQDDNTWSVQKKDVLYTNSWDINAALVDIDEAVLESFASDNPKIYPFILEEAVVAVEQKLLSAGEVHKWSNGKEFTCEHDVYINRITKLELSKSAKAFKASLQNKVIDSIEI